MDPRNLENARAFLKQPRIALVGVSRQENDFSRMIFRELATRGIDVVPVNPSVAELEGRRCFRSLTEVQPPVQAALLMTHPEQTGRILADCVAAGVKRVWLHRGAGKGSADASALAFCASNGLEVVKDLCPFMALPDAGLGHRVHAWFRQRLA